MDSVYWRSKFDTITVFVIIMGDLVLLYVSLIHNLLVSDDELFSGAKRETHRSLEAPPPRLDVRAIDNLHKRRWSTESGDNQKLVTSTKTHKLQRRVSEAEGVCFKIVLMHNFSRYGSTFK